MGWGLLHLVASEAVPDEEYSASVMPGAQWFSDNGLQEDRGKIACLRRTRDRNARPEIARRFRIEGGSTASWQSTPRLPRPTPSSVWRFKVVAAARGRKHRLSVRL